MIGIMARRILVLARRVHCGQDTSADAKRLKAIETKLVRYGFTPAAPFVSPREVRAIDARLLVMSVPAIEEVDEDQAPANVAATWFRGL